MLTPDTLPRLQALLWEQNLDGWLLFDFRGRNPIAAATLGEWIVGTRRVFVLVPRSARRVIAEAGLDSHIARRTGHSIDRFGLHGFGPPIDGTETHDGRPLVPGVGFSVEPGVYVKGETGARSEVNVYLTDDDAVVTPADYQNTLIVL